MLWASTPLFDGFLKALIVVEYGLGELIEEPEQIFGSQELDSQLARLEMDTGREIFHVAMVHAGRSIDPDGAARGEFTVSLQMIEQAGAAAVLSLKFSAIADLLEL